jgi:putative membrane protein
MALDIKAKLEKIKINFYFFYAVGIVGYAIDIIRPVMELVTPIVLFITAVYAFLRTYYDMQAEKRNKLIFWSLGVIAVTIIMEIMGVKYGLFFGQYKYGRILGPMIMGVPFIIGINWLIVVMGVTSFIRKFTDNLIVIAFFSGFLAFLFDYIMEPAAITVGFWDWAGPIPLKNYVSWFSITFLASAIATYLKIEISRKWTANLLAAQVIFFLFIRLFMLIKLL